MPKNRKFDFQSVRIEEGSAETLTVLFSDFNNDNMMDLLVGNDFKPADEYYQGTENGLQRSTIADSMFRVSPYYTMSITTADINNDLLLDTYAAGLNFDGPALTSEEEWYYKNSSYDNDNFQNFCNGYKNEGEYNLCMEVMNWRNIMPRRDPRLVNLENCEVLKEEIGQFRQSLALSMVFEAIKRNDATLCSMIEAEQSVQKEMCDNYFEYIKNAVVTKKNTEPSIPYGSNIK